MKLVGAREHFLARWDNPSSVRFNIEATAEGLACPSDDYYRTGKYEITPEQEAFCGFLRSKTPIEELAAFLILRGSRWRELGNYRRSAEAMGWASGIAPWIPGNLNCFKATMNEWLETIKARKPAIFPELHVYSTFRRFPEALATNFERDCFGLEAAENLLNTASFERSWWAPQRRGERVVNVPRTAKVTFNASGSCTITFQ